MARKKKMDRLTMDSIAAQKAGMSYGRWKAIHPHTGGNETNLPKKDKSVKLCGICGNEIPPGYSGKKYCSPECVHEAKLASYRRCYKAKKERMGAK